MSERKHVTLIDMEPTGGGLLKGRIDFDKPIRKWDGFGVNYVQMCQSKGKEIWDQDYSGFSKLTKEKKDEIMDLIFGEDGIKPGAIKMFLDPFHQKEDNLNEKGYENIDQKKYDHESTTKHMRYFAREGTKLMAAQGKKMSVITTYYSPPGFMTKQKFLRGRDLDNQFLEEWAKYPVAWTEYLRNEEGIDVEYISIHNEGEDFIRWPSDGSKAWIDDGHDYNYYNSPEDVVERMKILRKVLDARGLKEVGVTPGETSQWNRFTEWGYAHAIYDDEEALNSMGLITSHGFYNGRYSLGNGQHLSSGIDILREKNPKLHAWVTSTAWADMLSEFAYQCFRNIYQSKVNCIIPWALLQRPSEWIGGDPTGANLAIQVDEKGDYKLNNGYYTLKLLSRVGQKNSSIVRTSLNDNMAGIIGFKGNEELPDSFVAINNSTWEKKFKVKLNGTKNRTFKTIRIRKGENYKKLEDSVVEEESILVYLPPKSIVGFIGK